MNIKNNRGFLFIILVILLSCIPLCVQASFISKCVGVTDGDTIKVRYKDGVLKIRLDGIDCPEKAQPFGNKAKQYTSNLVFGKYIKVDIKDQDRYGRSVAVLSVNGINVNESLVSAGFAWWYKKYAPNNIRLQELESRAKQYKKGLWADSNSIPPWEWRRGGSLNNSGGYSGITDKSVLSDKATVYFTNTGECYHRLGCGSLSKSCYPIKLYEAKKSYRSCGRCNP